MCLSTAYYREKKNENIAAEYVAEIIIEDGAVRLIDVMGDEMRIEGTLKYVNLTGGTVIIEPAE